MKHRQVLGEDPLHLVEQPLALGLVQSSPPAWPSARRSGAPTRWPASSARLPEVRAARAEPEVLGHRRIGIGGGERDERGFEVALRRRAGARRWSRAARRRAAMPTCRNSSRTTVALRSSTRLPRKISTVKRASVPFSSSSHSSAIAILQPDARRAAPSPCRARTRSAGCSARTSAGCRA